MNVISDLRIISIRAEKCNFEWNVNYSKNIEHNHDLTFSVSILINAEDDHKGIIRLGCNVNEENESESPFAISLVMMGEFHTSDKPFEEYVVNAISLLFPYLRTYISTLTSMSGVEPLIIPAINIYELLEQNSTNRVEGTE